MPQPSAAYGSAEDGRSAGGLFGETVQRCRPANPLAALRRHPEALSRIEASLGRADFNAWGASALTSFAADCAVWANEAFGQSLLARGLALTGDAAAAAAGRTQSCRNRSAASGPPADGILGRTGSCLGTDNRDHRGSRHGSSRPLAAVGMLGPRNGVFGRIRASQRADRPSRKREIRRRAVCGAL